LARRFVIAFPLYCSRLRLTLTRCVSEVAKSLPR
jgi:hypothetical protein